MAADPLTPLAQWLEAAAAVTPNYNAMTLATVDPQGRPSARIVLYKGLLDGGLTFYTNYRGRKGEELASNPNVALVFFWEQLERQIRIEGTVERVPSGMSREYFYQRPRESQIGAITSRQSQVVASREALDQRYDEQASLLGDAEVPFPDYWGGYRVEPLSVEFWQGRLGRLHDRLRYRRDGSVWIIERLEP